MLVEASARSKALLGAMVCQTGAPGSTSMILDCLRNLGAPSHDGTDVVPARCPQKHKARAAAGLGIRAHQGIIGVDGV